jgi:hypothetical protein
MMGPRDDEGVDFGTLSPEIDDLLQRGVVAYRRDRRTAEQLFRRAMAAAPQELPVYFCLYKIHTYQGNMDEALSIAEAGLREAARQAGWGEDPDRWPRAALSVDGPGRFALYTLKALAFIHLKRGDRANARKRLDTLSMVDPGGLVGWRVVAELAQALSSPTG